MSTGKFVTFINERIYGRYMPVRFGLVRKLLRSFVEYAGYKIFFNPDNRRKLIDEFHNFYYESEIWGETYWFGNKVYKCPFDLWIYQEILFEIKPDVIIECGTARGGSALYLAHLCDILGKGKIYTVDIEENRFRQKHNRITYFLSSSIDLSVVRDIKRLIKKSDIVMVILDSDHRRDHVVKELELYAPLVTKGSYLIVEDTNINGHPVNKEYGPGPGEALQLFLEKNKDFVSDSSKEKFFVTFHPQGYLKRVQ